MSLHIYILKILKKNCKTKITCSDLKIQFPGEEQKLREMSNRI